MAPLKVLVIGAGSTGLALAQGLKQNGIECQVFEREEATAYQTRPREWGMTLHWGAAYVSKCIPPELRESLTENIACDPYYKGDDSSLPVFNAGTGEKLFDMKGIEPRRVSRRKLRNFLSQGLDVTYGKKLTGIHFGEDGQIVATFADGESAQGSLIVGCDGAHSIARECLVGTEAAQLEYMQLRMFNVSCAFPKETALLQRKHHPIFKNAVVKVGDDSFSWWQSIQDVQDPDKPETWRFQNVLSWIGHPAPEDLPDREARLSFWKEKAASMADPWKSTARDLPSDLPIVVDEVTYWKPFDWSASTFAGHVTLAGDSAHPIPPFRGQGLNQGLMDASDMLDALVAVEKGQKSLADAITSYESAMRDRALTEIPISVTQTRMIHNFDTFMEAPSIKHGMNVYKEDREAKGQAVETTGS